MPIWQIEPGLIDYPAALSAMESHVAGMLSGGAPEKVWLLQHPPLYTAGTSAKAEELLNAGRFPVFEAGRGGRYTYHGPGQRVAYVMLDLKQRGCDVRAYVSHLEGWVQDALASFGIEAGTREGRVGLWVKHKGLDQKIAAIGVRIRRWVTFHGVSINVNPDLSHFGGIVPCGLGDYGVTSMHALGAKAGLSDVDEALQNCWQNHFEVPFIGEMAHKMRKTG
ncbi:MAG TPA: lipoyl(octanoyl) transferase LipB [Alphaproteobacteria bacterium]|nr:lipoyl(octanoyl) transferase LipB [Alphaproteobacteria bacterium]